MFGKYFYVSLLIFAVLEELEAGRRSSKYSRPFPQHNPTKPEPKPAEPTNTTNSKYQYLFINKTSIFNLTDRNFNNITLHGKGSRKWFIMFYASWCFYSRELIPIWRELATNFTGIVNFGMVDW
jgi:thioredoxin-like negative regulator of GroEL